MNSNRLAAIGAFLAGLAVILGAFGAHGLEGSVTPHELDVWKTGAQYHLIHAVAILAVALADREGRFGSILKLWMAGITVFSGSLYLLVVTHTPKIGIITPLGGLCFIIGWLWLGWRLWKSESQT